MSIQVTFDPTIWTAGTGSGVTQGCNGYNAGGVFLDNDGVTAWAFEYNGAGFARFNILTGDIVHQGVAFGTEGSINFNNTQNGVVLFAQDTTGHYFIAVTNASNPSWAHKLYKFHITTGGVAGTLLNGYEVIDATYSLTSLPLSDYNDVFGLVSSLIWYAGSSNFLVLQNSYSTYAFDADTLGFLGSFNVTTSTSLMTGAYADTEGFLWVIQFDLALSGGTIECSFWTGQVTDQVLTYQPFFNVAQYSFSSGQPAVNYLELRYSVFAQFLVYSTEYLEPFGYSPLFLFASKTTNTCDSCLFSSWNGEVLVRKFDDLMFMQSSKSLFYATSTGEQTFYSQGDSSLGMIMFEGSTGSGFQTGGVLRMVDPTTLNIIANYDVTGTINSDSALTPVPYVVTPNGQSIIISQAQESSGNQITLTGINNLSLPLGSNDTTDGYLQFSECVGTSTWLNSVGSNSIQFIGYQGGVQTQVVCSDATAHGAFGPASENVPAETTDSWTPFSPALGTATASMTPPLHSFAWSTSSNLMLATYENGGSPVYILPTATGQLTTVSLSISPSPAQYGQPTTITATLTGESGVPTTGIVTFFDTYTPANLNEFPATVTIGTANVSEGTAILVYTAPTPVVGTHVITALYSGGGEAGL